MENLSTTPVGQLRYRQIQNLSLADRSALRLSATLLFVGVLLSLIAGAFHVDREPANTHSAAFTEYAHSGAWIAAHLGQFAGMAVLVGGFVALFSALNVRTGAAAWAARFGALSAGMALALYGMLQAVDGVALKHAVDAWVHAAETERSARFASAEALRWLEWGLRSYHSFMFGLALLFFAAVIAGTARVPRPIGYLMGLSGIAYIAQGWVIGVEGFSPTNTAPTLAGILMTVVWSSWLIISAWRMPEAGAVPAE